jgi:hypothetical protein
LYLFSNFVFSNLGGYMKLKLHKQPTDQIKPLTYATARRWKTIKVIADINQAAELGYSEGEVWTTAQAVWFSRLAEAQGEVLHVCRLSWSHWPI